MRRSHQCLGEAVKYLEDEVIFRDVRHVCRMHKREFIAEGREDPCVLLGRVESDKLNSWDRFKRCMRGGRKR